MRAFLLSTALVLLVASSATAQDYRVEIGGHAGYTFSEGITFPPPSSGTVNPYDRADPRNAFSFGGAIEILYGEGSAIGFLWNRQQTDLLVRGRSERLELSNFRIDNYHAIFSFNFGYADESVRPYVLGGFGATSYGSLDTAAGRIDGETRFSMTWGAGVKLYPGAGNFGIRFGARWTPTYIRSDPGGVWCDPFWGCFTTEDTQFSNQLELGAGLSLRF